MAAVVLSCGINTCQPFQEETILVFISKELNVISKYLCMVAGGDGGE